MVCGKIESVSKGSWKAISSSFKPIAQLYSKVRYNSVELEAIVLNLIHAVTPKKKLISSYDSTADVSDTDIAACFEDT